VSLPPAQGRPYRVALVCLGNICRSPTADVVLNAYVDRAGLADRVEVTSAGTGDWHVGEPMDRRAAATLRDADFDPDRHRAQQFTGDWFDRDLVLAMDAANLRDVRALGGEPDRVRMFRDFDPAGPGDVPDPWGGGQQGFAEVLAMVERTSAVLVDELGRLLG
jgi:protein-tyrosine phosphatase